MTPIQSAPDSRLTTASIVWILLIGAALGCVTLAYPVGGWDIPTYSYIASVLLEGGAPYHDAWDLKSPGIFFVHALGQVVFGKSAVAVRLLDVMWQLLTAVMVAYVGLRVTGKQNAGRLAGVLYLVTYFARNAWDWSQPDSFVSLPLGVAVAATLVAMQKDTFWLWTLAGMGVGLAVLLKPPFGLLGIAMLLMAVTTGPRGLSARARRWLALAVGLSVPLAACAAFFFARGALADLYVAQFLLAPEYVQRIHSYRSVSCLFRSALQPVNAPADLLGLLGLGTVLTAWWQRAEGRMKLFLVLAWAVVALVVMVMHGKYDSMHYVSFLAPVTVLGAAGLEAAWFSSRTNRRLAAVGVLVVLGVMLAVPAKKLLQHANYTVRSVRGQIPMGNDPARELGTYLRERANPGDTLFVWGGSPSIYYYSGLRSCTRFIHVYFLAIGLRSADLRPVFWKEFQANRPKYFVLITAKPRGGTAEPIVDFTCPPEQLSAESSFQEFPGIRPLVEREYEVQLQKDDYILFRRKQSAPAPGGPTN